MEFSGSPDSARGLTEAGLDLALQCDSRCTEIDLQHLTGTGLDDGTQVSTAPLVATHFDMSAVWGRPPKPWIARLRFVRLLTPQPVTRLECR